MSIANAQDRWFDGERIEAVLTSLCSENMTEPRYINVTKVVSDEKVVYMVCEKESPCLKS